MILVRDLLSCLMEEIPITIFYYNKDDTFTTLHDDLKPSKALSTMPGEVLNSTVCNIYPFVNINSPYPPEKPFDSFMVANGVSCIGIEVYPPEGK